MPATPPPLPLATSALGVGLEAFVAVRAAIAGGFADARASFELTLSAPSSDWGFLVLAGVEPLVDALERLRIRVDEVQWLESVGAIDGATRRLLADARFSCDVDAVAEGSVAFPGEAVVSVEGPYWQAQLVGGLVQSAVVEATAVATRFARMALAAGGAETIERGAATSHRLGGVPLLARAAYVGGARATTSTLAARRYGIPVATFPAASLEVAAGAEERALRAWIAACPGDCVLRLDPARVTVTLPRLVSALRTSPASEWRNVAIELPSGDRAGLAAAVARAFTGAGQPVPALIVSGDVDERLALELRSSAWIKAYALPAEVPGASRLARYELVAIEEAGTWSPRLHAGVDSASPGYPGRKLLVRYADATGRPVADVAHASGERMARAAGGKYVDLSTGLPGRLATATSAPLRGSVMRAGKRAAPADPLVAIRERAAHALQRLDEGHLRIVSPGRYPVGVTQALASLRTEVLARADAG